MNRKEQIEQEMKELIQELEPDEPEESKKQFNYPRLLLFAAAGVLFFGLTVTFIPDPKPVVVYQIQDTIAYPINQKGTEITVRTLEPGENFPNIKIGPGCSMTRRSKPKSEDSFQRI